MERQFRGKFYSELQKRLKSKGEAMLTENQEKAVYETLKSFNRYVFGLGEKQEQEERMLRPFNPEILLDQENPPGEKIIVRLTNSLKKYVSDSRGEIVKTTDLTDGDAVEMHNLAVKPKVGAPVHVEGFGDALGRHLSSYIHLRGLEDCMNK
jgi:hypothetical protein